MYGRHLHLCSQAGPEPSCESDPLLGMGHVVLSKKTSVSPSRKPQLNEVDRLIKGALRKNVINLKEGITTCSLYM